MQLEASSLEITRKLIQKINTKMQEKDWSLTRLSIESGVPYDSLKKYLSYKISNPHYYNIVRICYALDMNLGELLPNSTASSDQSSVFPEPSHSRHLIDYITRLEESIRICSEDSSHDYIPILRPIGIRHSNALYLDSFSQHLLDVSAYRKRYGNSLSYGISIQTNAYHPVYLENDILLIGNDRIPTYGETGVFIYNGQLFLRRYLPGNPIRLEPLNGIGHEIVLTSLKDWFIFGYVLTVYR